MQNTAQLVLEDGHSQSMVSALTSGPGSDLIGTLSTTKPAGGGAYSPYVGSGHGCGTHHGKPAHGAVPVHPRAIGGKDDRVDLKLNNPPSFRKPKSVMVVGLPAVEAAQFPPLRPVDAKQTFCLQKPGLVLPAEGAPLVFSTQLAHHLVLQLKGKLPAHETQQQSLPETQYTGQTVELPVTADPLRGGVAIETKLLPKAELGTESYGHRARAVGLSDIRRSQLSPAKRPCRPTGSFPPPTSRP